MRDKCDFEASELPFDAPGVAPLSLACRAALAGSDLAVGPHNVYDVYDNCADGTTLAMWYEVSGKSPRWLAEYVREHRFDAAALDKLSEATPRASTLRSAPRFCSAPLLVAPRCSSSRRARRGARMDRPAPAQRPLSGS